jgi:hypothetical protein
LAALRSGFGVGGGSARAGSASFRLVLEVSVCCVRWFCVAAAGVRLSLWDSLARPWRPPLGVSFVNFRQACSAERLCLLCRCGCCRGGGGCGCGRFGCGGGCGVGEGEPGGVVADALGEVGAACGVEFVGEVDAGVGGALPVVLDRGSARSGQRAVRPDVPGARVISRRPRPAARAAVRRRCAGAGAGRRVPAGRRWCAGGCVPQLVCGDLAGVVRVVAISGGGGGLASAIA